LATEPVRLALDCLPDASLLVDEAERIVYANTAYERMSGFDLTPVQGRPLRDFVELDGAMAAPESALCRRRHGGFAPCTATVRPMAGALAGRLRLVRLEENGRRRSLLEELSSGLDIKGEFLARVSHELRTPLTAMQEGIDVVLDGLTGPLNERQIEFLQLARRNAQRLNRLVKDTLEFDSLKRGETPRRRQACSLVRMVRLAASRYEQVECANAPSLWVQADPPRIEDAIGKLVENAVRHSGGGAVRVAMWREGAEAVLEVADSGPGIPQDKLCEVFGEFEQLSVGPGRTVGGVGLGLTIAKLIVEQHGGRIWAESGRSNGCRFYIALKTCPPPAEEFHDDCDASQDPSRR
jgi:signal transduction histidine kinase